MITISLIKTEKVFPRNNTLDSWSTPRTINMRNPWEYGEDLYQINLRT